MLTLTKGQNLFSCHGRVQDNVRIFMLQGGENFMFILRKAIQQFYDYALQNLGILEFQEREFLDIRLLTRCFSRSQFSRFSKRKYDAE